MDIKMAKMSILSTQRRVIFANEMFKTICEHRETENFVISTFAIRHALALVYLGVEASAATEIKKALNINQMSKNEIADYFSRLGAYPKSGNAVIMLGNRLYVHEKFQLSTKFNELAAICLQSTAEQIDFNRPELVIASTNKWVAEATEQHTTTILDEHRFSNDTSGLLLSALNFIGTWDNIFLRKETRKGLFLMNDKQSTNVEMMSQQNCFLTGELQKYQASGIALPFLDSEMCMLIIMPKDVNGLAALEERICEMDFRKMQEKFEMVELNLQLPKFSIKFDMPLKGILKQLGILSIFDGTANFNGLVGGSGDAFQIDDVLHKTAISFSELGTETKDEDVMLARISSATKKNFIVNHPFLFVLKDSQNIYMCGHVVSIPEAKSTVPS